MFYKLYVLRDFFWQPSLIKLESSSEKQQAHNILSWFTIAANFRKGVVEQVIDVLHHVSKNPWYHMRSRKQLKSSNIMYYKVHLKYFYRNLAWLMECLYSEDQIQLSRKKLAVGTSGWLPEHNFNIWIPRCVLFVRFWFCSLLLC